MQIGKIVKSNTHVDYVCQVYGPGEIDPLPSPDDYAFGTFVRLTLADDASSYLVGLIYSTILMNPEFGNLGPRLSPPADIEIFTPDYLREQATLVGIVAVGQVTSAGARQGVPLLAASVNAQVSTVSTDEVRAFHQADGDLSLTYLPLLLTQGDPLIPHLMLNVINQLDGLFPDRSQKLAVLRGNLAWKTTVAPMR
jgi:hypothetical protein